MTLNKKKFRYICIFLQSSDTTNRAIFHDFINQFYKRLEGLFGSISYYKSFIKIINVNSVSSNFVIIKCKLEYVDNVLLSLCFTNSSILILPVSGTIKQLKKRIKTFLSYRELFINT